jgi:hypothetical protein
VLYALTQIKNTLEEKLRRAEGRRQKAEGRRQRVEGRG